MGPKKSGKKWHHQQQPKRPRQIEEDGGGDNSSKEEQRPKKPRRAAVISLGNVKGHQAVVGTCDIRNDRQATAELVDLLNEVADDMYPAEAEEHEAGSEGGGATAVEPSPTATTSTKNESEGGDDGAETEKSASSATATTAGAVAGPEKSVEEMIREEAAELRSGKAKTHRFKSVNTNVKGVVMVCVMDPKVDILRLVDALYAEIRTTKMRRSRFLERVTPLQVTAYSELEAFKEAAKPIVSAGLPPVAEGVPTLPVVVRAAAPNAVVEVGATVSKDTPAAEATPAVEDQAANAETSGTAAAAISTGDKVEVDGGKPAATLAAASGNGTPSEKKDGSVSAGGNEAKTSDKRWKFRVDIRRRNSALDRLALINAVVGSVGEGHSASMSSPEVSTFGLAVFFLPGNALRTTFLFVS